jgi:hypothetical protein
MLITKDLQNRRSEELIQQAQVSAKALLSIIQRYTRSWPERFGRDNYRVFMEKVVDAFEVLGIRLKSDPKDLSHNDK